MIGQLPTQLQVNNELYDIRTDYRDCLLVLSAFKDNELSDWERMLITVQIIYINPPSDYVEEAYLQAVRFLDCNLSEDFNKAQNNTPQPTLYDWNKDEQMIFSAINKVAGREIRADKYMHWWTFVALFNEIGDGMFASVVNIRNKKARHKKLEKYEQEFYRNNKELIDMTYYHKERSEADKKALQDLFG